MMRIFLVGFMGSGKTTLGRALARDLHLEFIDMDNYIEGRFRKTVSELFAERGEAGFRQLECNILHEVAEFEDVIVATGGGTPCHFDNMDYMNSHGITVHLEASPEVLFTRLTISHTQRPLLAGKSGDDLKKYIADMLEARAPFYTLAQRSFCADELEDRTQVAKSVARFRKEILDLQDEQPLTDSPTEENL